MYKSFKQSVALYKQGELWHLKPWKRHSLVLLISGLGYSLIGVSYIVAEPNESRTVALQYALNWFSLQLWGIWFVVTGIITVISSRWPPVSRTWGYTMLTGLSSAWALFYLFGIVFGDSPLTNISSALLWGIFAFLWWAISGLMDPTVVIIKDENDGQV